MSTWLYLECMDHDPPIRADSESGQHLSDLPQIRGDIAMRDKLVELYELTEREWPSEHWRRNTVSFLAQHPKCHIRIRDEYGREHLIVDLPEGETT